MELCECIMQRLVTLIDMPQLSQDGASFDHCLGHTKQSRVHGSA